MLSTRSPSGELKSTTNQITNYAVSFNKLLKRLPQHQSFFRVRNITLWTLDANNVDATDCHWDPSDLPVDAADCHIDETDQPVDSIDQPVDVTDYPVDETY